MSVKARSSAVVIAAIFAALTGCHRTPKPADHYDLNGAKGSVAVVANDTVILDLPNVSVDKGTITISGTVHRQPQVSGEVAGRVDIEFLGPDGEYLDGLPALLSPRNVPTNPGELATYSTSYGYVPPAGSTVRVHFVDKETEIQEDNAGTDYGYGGGRGGQGGRATNGNGTHGTDVHTGSHASMHW